MKHFITITNVLAGYMTYTQLFLWVLLAIFTFSIPPIWIVWIPNLIWYLTKDWVSKDEALTIQHNAPFYLQERVLSYLLIAMSIAL